MQDVIVAEDFTLAAASAMADDVTGLGFAQPRTAGRNHQTGDVSLDPLRWGLIP